ncbi:MAG: AMP-binding protein, partial [Actinoallomurus sp.]
PEQTELLTLADYLVGRRLTHWFSVPSAVSVGAELGGLPAEPVPGLRYSMFAGEQLTYGQADTWRALAPRSVIDNLFGPTELTVLCAEYRLPVDRRHWPETSNGTVPIGDVYTHLDHLIKADTGELCVRGSQRFDGYLDPRDDSGRFLDHHEAGPLTGEHYYRTGDRVRREAGALVHLGRLDNQVKIHGYRVELGELEAVLRRHPRVSQAAVIAIEHGEETELIACYTGEPVRRGELRRSLGGWLPIHLMPHRFLHLESMPLNANGKVDRGVLRDIALHGSAASRE